MGGLAEMLWLQSWKMPLTSMATETHLAHLAAFILKFISAVTGGDYAM